MLTAKLWTNAEPEDGDDADVYHRLVVIDRRRRLGHPPAAGEQGFLPC